MGFFRKSKGNTSEEIENWYQDRYTSVAVQKNFLLLFSVFTSVALMICLIALKRAQEGAATEPYLIEYDKNTGYMTIVESKSKQEYTAQQAVKESMVLQYIYHREAPKITTLEEDMNYIRVSTLAKIYPDYLNDVSNYIKALKHAGNNPSYKVAVKSLQYTSSNRLLVTLTKTIMADDKEISSMDYHITITFGFVDLEVPIEDMRINPLGFQVSYYKSTPIKVFNSEIMPDSKATTNQANADETVKNVEKQNSNGA